jgi:hypothetical protein
MAVSSLLFKGVPSPLNLKILAACVVRDSSVENEAYLDTPPPQYYTHNAVLSKFSESKNKK